MQLLEGCLQQVDCFVPACTLLPTRWRVSGVCIATPLGNELGSLTFCGLVMLCHSAVSQPHLIAVLQGWRCVWLLEGCGRTA